MIRHAEAEDVRHAERWLRTLIEQLDMGDPEAIGDGTGTYDQIGGLHEAYMVGGGGPTGWLHFVRPRTGALFGFLRYTHAGPEVLVPVPAEKVKSLLAACRRDGRARRARG